jgi:LytR cell envelope-related transcriptional attenuator
MGRRSSPNQWPFYRSVLSWFVPWALVAVIVGIGVWIAVDALSGGASNGKPSAALAGGSSPSTSSHQTPRASPSPTSSAGSSHKEKPKPPLITKGITVQVLDATSDPAAGQRIATRLDHLGFQIAVVGAAASSYDRTTVYWAYPTAKPAAKALAARFGWIAAPKPANLSPQVALHVVVGADAL